MVKFTVFPAPYSHVLEYRSCGCLYVHPSGKRETGRTKLVITLAVVLNIMKCKNNSLVQPWSCQFSMLFPIAPLWFKPHIAGMDVRHSVILTTPLVSRPDEAPSQSHSMTGSNSFICHVRPLRLSR